MNPMKFNLYNFDDCDDDDDDEHTLNIIWGYFCSVYSYLPR